MAIDKIIPRFLVSDKDERLLEEGAMTDALNVTISEDGDGTEGVIKNVEGTASGVPLDSSSYIPRSNEVKVVGQASDPQRNFIYFFVADADATGDYSNGNQHAIYQYDASNNRYRTVFKNSWLKFNPSGFVKADVLNGAFQQDGVIQTILYFTDNLNHPRKINVDRAILGDYDDLPSTKLDHALRCIKSAPIDVPTFSFDTDSTIDVNNFTNNLFQFALQYVYKDGEESAISGYSALAYPEVTPLQNIENASTGRQYYEDNICVIDTNWSPNVDSVQNIPDVDKLRILGRQGNNGSFFVIDEFNPNQDLTRVVLGDSTQVYDSDSGTYKFYNDGVYSGVANTLVDKLYDNVPLKAQGQAISSNRLFYSDYVEGFENTDVSAAIQVGYSADRFGGTNSTSNSVSEYSSIDKERGRIEIDCDSIFSSSNVPAGSKTTISFDWDAEGSFSYESATDYAIEVNAIDTSDNSSFVIGFGNKQPGGSYDSWSGGVILKKSGSTDFSFSITITNQDEITTSEFADLLNEAIGDFYWSKTYQASDLELRGRIKSSSSSNYSNGQQFSPDSGNYSVNTAWHFNTSSVVNNNTVVIVPTLYFASIDISSSTGSSSYTISTQSFNSGSNLLYHINNDVTSSFPFGTAAWHETLNVGSDFYLSNPLVSSSAFFSQSTFKAGCMHDLGVVYYDKHNRSGNVNKIGSFYVEPFSDTTGSPRETGNGTGVFNNGASYVSINFTSEPPDWAERYQIVYPGMSTYSSVVQYTTGPAFFDNPGDNADSDNKRIYVSLRTLSNYKDQKAAQRSYSYTEGDKLRVISADTASATSAENRQYLKANDGSIIEFNVMGVVRLPQDGVTFYNQHETSSTADVYEGDFLVLEAPAVAAGLETEVGGTSTNLKYPGFDWFQISQQAYPGTGGTPTQLNYWGNKCLVEILTPRKQASEKVYYEIGESRKVGGYKGATGTDHGPQFVVNNGDLHFTPISCLTPWRDGTHTNEHVDGSSSPNWNHLNIPNWRYEDISLESMSVSDFFDSQSWDKGRAHVVYENAAEIRRFNGLTYSDAYEEDVANLSLSSFNPALANFDSLDSKFGAVEYIGNYNDDLVALQENKLSLVPLNKNIIEYAGGTANVAVSTNVVNQPRYSAGDYGSGGHPEAVLVQDNSVYFVDESRQAVCALTGGQLVPISEKNMSSFFEGFFSGGATRYVSGYDPRNSTYYVTRRGSSEDTVGYDASRGVWQSRYSFIPDAYSNLNNFMYSFKYEDSLDIGFANLIWKHSNSIYNKFYLTAHNSEVQVFSKLSPSRVKVYNALSYESDSGNWDVVGNTDITTDLNQETGDITSWRENEGSYYAAMPRDKSSNSTSHKIFVGTLSTTDSITFTSTVNLSHLPIPLGVNVTINGETVEVISVGKNKLTLQAENASVAGSALYLEAPDSHGDPIRGHYAKIKLTLPSADAGTKQELYCINTHITDSKRHHALGEQ